MHRDAVKQSHRVRRRRRADDLRGFDHVFKIGDAAVVAAHLALCHLVFVILGKIALLPCRTQIFAKLRPQRQLAIFNLLFHLININLRQLVVHQNTAFFRSAPYHSTPRTKLQACGTVPRPFSYTARKGGF